MYKFKSPAAGDLIMLEPNGQQILKIIGKADSPTPHQGILLPADMPAAVAALEAAIVQDEKHRADLVQKAKENGEPAPRFDGISLKLRALPFIEMIRRCHKAEKEIVWGV